MKTVIFNLDGAILRSSEEVTTLHKGVTELLPIFHRLGVKNIAFAPVDEQGIEHLERLGAHHHFHYIASDAALKTTPRHEGLQQLIVALQLSGDILLVGDRVTDIILGKNAGITTVVGVSHGRSTPEALRAAGADHVVHDLPALLDILG